MQLISSNKMTVASVSKEEFTQYQNYNKLAHESFFFNKLHIVTVSYDTNKMSTNWL